MAGRWNIAVLGFVGLVYFALAPAIVAMFTSDPEPARWSVLCLRIVGLGFPFYGYGMVVVQSFNGAGDTYADPRQHRMLLALRAAGGLAPVAPWPGPRRSLLGDHDRVLGGRGGRWDPVPAWSVEGGAGVNGAPEGQALEEDRGDEGAADATPSPFSPS